MCHVVMQQNNLIFQPEFMQTNQLHLSRHVQKSPREQLARLYLDPGRQRGVQSIDQ